jgi:hypothetical protein
MKKERVYRQWKEHRRQVPVPDHFTGSVMQRVMAMPRENKAEPPTENFDLQNRLTRLSAAGGLILLGLFRILYILANLLQPQLLMR